MLVIEDDPHLRRILSLAVERRGHEVLTASDGAEGLALARSRAPDAILLDLMLPVMDGYRVLRALAARAVTGAVPVIVLTARDGDGERSLGLSLGARDYVTKPFALADVLARLESLLARPLVPAAAAA